MSIEVLTIGGFFVTVIVLAIGVPLVRVFVRRVDRRAALSPQDPEQMARLMRIEQAVDSMAVEIERISEGQRFVTKLLSEPVAAPALPDGSGRAGVA